MHSIEITQFTKTRISFSFNDMFVEVHILFAQYVLRGWLTGHA